MTSPRADHYSGLLVVTLPGRFEECARVLEEQAGVTVSVREASRDRMIVVLEAPDLDRLEELHRSVRALPGVVAADPVVHYVDDHPQDPVPDP